MKNVLLILTTFISFSFSQGFDKAKADAYFDRIEKANKAMGSISILHKGQLVYSRTFGYENVETKTTADLNTKYRIGSISKSFTASIIMQMIDEGKLTLETKLAKFYSDLPNAQKISIEMLLRHRSGLFNFTNSESYTSWMESKKTQQELLAIFKADTIEFEPDTKASYSNTNYVLLSFIAEKIDHKSFKDILANRIAKPLKLKNTYIGSKINSEKNEAQSYNITPTEETYSISSETDMSIPLGAGAVVSTPSDLNTFYLALFNGKLVSSKSLEEMKKVVDRYGIGLFTFPFNGKKALGHTGGIDSFQSIAGYFKEEELSLALTTNALAIPMNDISIAVLSIYFKLPFELPEFKASLKLTSSDLDPYLGIYGSPTFPLKIKIFKKENVLMAQATGQSSFPLNPYEKDKFNMESYGIDMIFFPSENKLVFTQGGQKIELSRE
jgi:CubicO group peptidase (beta-lactamase class C family)